MDCVDETGLSYSHWSKNENPYLLCVSVEEEVLDVLQVCVPLSAQRYRKFKNCHDFDKKIKQKYNKQTKNNNRLNNMGRNPAKNSPPLNAPPRVGLRPQESHGFGSSGGSSSGEVGVGTGCLQGSYGRSTGKNSGVDSI